MLKHAIHHALFLADAQSADGIAVKAYLDRAFEALVAEIKMSGALNNAE
jgi:hypothetical protein